MALPQSNLLPSISSSKQSKIVPFPSTLDSNEAGLLSLLRRAASMANTQRRTVPSPTDLNYAFLMENIHTYSLEDEMARWPSPPQLAPTKGILIIVLSFSNIEPLNPALLPSAVDERVYTRAILPSSLRPASNTPAFIPAAFPRFPPKYTYSFTPTYPPRATDPETILQKAIKERTLVEQNLARLIPTERLVQSTDMDIVAQKEGRDEREEIWWNTWKDMGCDFEHGTNEVWPVSKVKRGLAGSL
jgi:hypothetical protein